MPLGGALTLGGLSLASGYLNNRAQSNQQTDRADLYNNWLQNYQGNAQDFLGQAQAGGWNPFGPSTTTSQNQNYGTSQGTSTTNFNNKPVITGQYQGIDQLMRGIMQGRLGGGTGLPEGYESSAARGINESYAGADAAARNLAARHGLSGEQSYAVASPANRARAGDLADMRASLPLLARELQNQDIGIASGLQSAFGTGQRGSSTTNTMGSTSNYGSGSVERPFNVGDLSALTQLMSGPGPQEPTQTGISPTGQGISDLGSVLGFMMATGQIGGPTGPGIYGGVPQGAIPTNIGLP